MKKILVLAACLVLVSSAAFAASIINSAHDLSSLSTGATVTSTTDQTCIHCHAPHNTVQAPLWNRTNPAAGSFGTYTTQAGNPWQPGPTSMACLSCHDGTIELPVYSRQSFTYTGTMGPNAQVAGDTAQLGNDHPIGISVPTGTGWNAPTLPLFATLVECGSCHNVHDPGFVPFLRISNAQSAICMNCHDK